MAKYRLTVKYNDVCELSLDSDIPDIIGSEFDQYVKSMLYKKQDWENFETNFKEAAKLEYGNLGKKEIENMPEIETANIAEAPKENIEESILEAPNIELKDTECDISHADNVDNLNENKNAAESKNDKNTVAANEKDTAAGEKDAIAAIKENKKTKKTPEILAFEEYIKGKNINTPLDEFVAGACYLDAISDIKEFSLKQLNAKLYPVFNRLANSDVIESAVKRVLIETIKNGSTTKYKINQNAWNYHNYDLIGH